MALLEACWTRTTARKRLNSRRRAMPTPSFYIFKYKGESSKKKQKKKKELPGNSNLEGENYWSFNNVTTARFFFLNATPARVLTNLIGVGIGSDLSRHCWCFLMSLCEGKKERWWQCGCKSRCGTPVSATAISRVHETLHLVNKSLFLLKKNEGKPNVCDVLFHTLKRVCFMVGIKGGGGRGERRTWLAGRL